MVDAVAARGYAGTRVRDVLALARMSRRTFYGHFDNVEDCFFAAYEAIRDDTLGLLDEALTSSSSAEQRLARAIDALLAHFAAWPSHALVLMVHAAGAGPQALAEHERTMAQLARRLSACLGARHGATYEEPDLVAQAVIGALQRLLQLGLLDDHPQGLTRMGPTLTAVALRIAA
jgi:AcrR family transcriptional regulator